MPLLTLDPLDPIVCVPPAASPLTGAPVAQTPRSGLRDTTVMIDADLIDAAHRGDVFEVGALLGLGANVNGFGLFGETALHSAALQGHGAVCERLIQSGADVDKENVQKCAPLYLASLNGRVGAVRVLLDGNANPNLAGQMGLTALHAAANNDSAAICTMLVAAGADINKTCEKEKTPLHGAARWGREQACCVLISMGARTDLKASGATPAGLASRYGHSALSEQIKAMALSRKAAQAVDALLLECAPKAQNPPSR